MGRIKGKTADWVDTGFKDNTFNLMLKDRVDKTLVPGDRDEFRRLSVKYFASRNVYENRVLAQRIGVESATTLPKQELIEQLLDKIWGVQYFSKGFPRSKYCDMGLLDADVELEILEDIKKGDVIIGTEVEGIFETREEGGVLWDINGNFADAYLDTYVPRNLVGEFKLQEGDKLKARMRYVEQLGYNVVFHIDEINGILVDVTKERPAVTCTPIKPFEKIELVGNDKLIMGLQLFAPVCYGQFGVVSISGRTDFVEQSISIFNAIKKDDLIPQTFILGAREYSIDAAKEQLADYKTVYYTKMQEDQTFYLSKVLQYVSTQAKYNGSKHVVIVSDLDMLDDEETENGVTPMQLASYAGAYSNGGSVTIIAVANSYSPLGAYHTVRNHADFELAFKSTASIRQNVIDVLSSYSISAREVSKEEMIALTKMQQFFVTEGANAVERRLVSYGSVEELIKQLND